MAKFHFIAIGGAVMHQLALHLHKEGNIITGSDDAIFDPAKTNLANAQILPNKLGWFPEKITTDIDAIILGMHAKEDNPELIQAKLLNLKIYSFPEFFYEQCKNKTRIVVAGSHGKTSITAMIAHIFRKEQIDFDYLIGAKLDGFNDMVATHSNNNYAVIEGDEYLTSALDLRSKFLHYHPTIAIISGIAWDHINVFPTFESYLDTFKQFILSIENNGYLIYNKDDKDLHQLVSSLSLEHLQIIPYSHFDYHIINEIVYINYNNNSYPIKIFGKHNLYNLKAAVEATNCIINNEHKILNDIQSFSGAAKRLELVYNDAVNFITIYRDFAHAPSKVRATVDAVSEKYSSRKFIALFEMHTYSSLQENFISQYADSLSKATTKLIYIDEEALKIKNKSQFDATWLKQQFNDDSIIVIYNSNELLNQLKLELTNNTVLLLMSSGNLGGITIDNLI